MESNSKKNGGFGLIEVVISMAIMGIISVSVYTGYILSIKHTKEGQVKQEAALEGKKVVEEIKSTDIKLDNSTLDLGNIQLKEQGNTEVYKRYLDENYKDKNDDGTDISEDSRKYTEIVTITPTQAISTNNNSSETVNLDINQQPESGDDDINYMLYISNKQISDTEVDEYISDDKTNLEQAKLSCQGKITLFMYVKAQGDNGRIITIQDANGKELLEKIISVEKSLDKVNIIFNFDNYQQIASYLLSPVFINAYNTTNSNIPNVYLQKSTDVNVSVKSFQGEVDSHDNLSGNQDASKVGQLYDIKVEIGDYNNETQSESDNLFTAYYKQNIQ